MFTQINYELQAMNTVTQNNSYKKYLDTFLNNGLIFSDYREITHDKIDYLLVSKSIAFICSNIESKIKILDICLHVGTNRTNLFYLFKRYFDQSPGRIVKELKLKYAKEMLKNTDMRICDISYRLGFTDSNNFSTFFRLMSSITPSEYRSQK